ncbi:TrkA domain protein [Bacillus thuringiensis IBL 200]|uniref:RCK C-terminal domain-containing protein n=1 Tax=Bacillus thuringiensis serovar toumanoffi TaxID=180862 RepID=A0ABD5I990_BACTU|nr:TrkA domain protein [Bacillus thuringiensis IBL 200]MDW9213593.1 RCK C-terminal domain-containing protein [Bacillus thuringiensis serovar toumanoffi]OTZ53866.1 hypothetical protein BK762_08795 [Bacillus thuringiensis serovar toumanoffi]PNK42251.1 hypothetical protein CBR58_28825 [Bacillus thuringiensis]
MSIFLGLVEPKALETIEMVFKGITIECFKVKNKALAAEKTIGQLEIRKIYNVTVIAIIRENMKKLFNPGPELVIEEGDMLVVPVERNEVKKLINELLSNRGD